MINIELRLLTAMLYSGDFSPIVNGDVGAEHFLTDQGKVLYNFITTYHSRTDGVARFPSLSIVKNRFVSSAVELPTPEPADNVKALAHETVVQKVRADISTLATDLGFLATESDPLQGLSAVSAKLKALTGQVQKTRHLSLSDGIEEVAMDYDAGSILTNGIPWPWPSMNVATKGMHNKELIVLGGRPKTRKTFIALKIGAHAVKVAHARVLCFTPEMPPKQMLLRFIATFCELHYTEFKNSALDPAEEMRLIEAVRVYGKMQNEDDTAYRFRLHSEIPDMPEWASPSFDVVQSTGKTIGWMKSQIEIYEPHLVIADSLYRQSPDDMKRGSSDWGILTAVSRQAKDLAMETSTVVIATHQMNRGADDKIGTLSNLSFADAFGQDADAIFRVVTGRIDGEQRSAICNLGGREIPFDGVLINNKPCHDYNEIGLITSRKQVERLIKRDDAEEEKQEAIDKAAEEAKKNIKDAAGGGRGKTKVKK